MSRVFLIDAHALCYRAFFAVKDLRNSKGQPTNAVFGFVNILKKIQKSFSPEYMAACFDTGKPTKRHAQYADYKIQRPSMPEDLVSQIPIIKDVIRAYRIPIFEIDGVEADDVLGTLARRFRQSGPEVVIVSDDKDMYQLVGSGISVYDSRRDALMGVKETQERFGVLPERITDYLALIGDASDNIPGVYGVGEVTAKSLIGTYGSLDNILSHADELKGKLKDKIAAGRESAILSKELATLDCDVPVICALDDVIVKEPDAVRLADIFSELGFKKNTEQIPQSADKAPVLPEKLKEINVVSSADVCISAQGAAGFSAQALRVGRCSILLGSESPEDLFAERMIYAAVESEVFPIPASEVAQIKAVISNRDVRKIVYGFKEVMTFFRKAKLEACGEFFDVELAGYLLQSGRGAFGIDALAWQYLGQALAGEGSARSAREALTLFQLEVLLAKDLKDTGCLDLFHDVEMPLGATLSAMEMEGVRLDGRVLAVLSAECDQIISGLTAKVHAAAGEEFNLNSPKQLGVVLFEKLKLPVGRKTKTGYSTDEETLHSLAARHELPALVLEYRQVAKLKSTYIDALPKLVNPETGRIHCSFNQTGTETGRLSSNHPNLQNIPVRSELGRKIRKAFVADHVLLSADYSQIELRVLAHLAEEPNLKKAFEAGEDIHRWTAGLMFDVPPGNVTDQMRYSAKRINFGIIYGMSPFGLAKDLGVSNREAQDFIDRYFLKYPGIRQFMDAEVAKARTNGYVETMFHRRRYLPDIASRNPAVRQFAERQAVNTPVQGTAADMIKIAMVRLEKALKDSAVKARMLITVHDELVFDVVETDLKQTVCLVKDVMVNACRLSVPVEVTAKAGKNWAEMEKI